LSSVHRGAGYRTCAWPKIVVRKRKEREREKVWGPSPILEGKSNSPTTKSVPWAKKKDLPVSDKKKKAMRRMLIGYLSGREKNGGFDPYVKVEKKEKGGGEVLFTMRITARGGREKRQKLGFFINGCSHQEGRREKRGWVETGQEGRKKRKGVFRIFLPRGEKIGGKDTVRGRKGRRKATKQERGKKGKARDCGQLSTGLAERLEGRKKGE